MEDCTMATMDHDDDPSAGFNAQLFWLKRVIKIIKVSRFFEILHSPNLFDDKSCDWVCHQQHTNTHKHTHGHALVHHHMADKFMGTAKWLVGTDERNKKKAQKKTDKSITYDELWHDIWQMTSAQHQIVRSFWQFSRSILYSDLLAHVIDVCVALMVSNLNVNSFLQLHTGASLSLSLSSTLERSRLISITELLKVYWISWALSHWLILA